LQYSAMLPSFQVE